MNSLGKEPECGPGFVPGPGIDAQTRERLESLHTEVSRILGTQFEAAQDELQQLRHLLEDAAVKLADGFTHIDRGARRQERLAREMVTAPRPEAIAEVHDISAAITQWAGISVQGLQFEDMAGQLIQHLGRRLLLLEEFSVDMSLLRAHLEDESQAAVPGLKLLESALERHREELMDWEQKAVMQKTLDTGTVDLF